MTTSFSKEAADASFARHRRVPSRVLPQNITEEMKAKIKERVKERLSVRKSSQF